MESSCIPRKSEWRFDQIKASDESHRVLSLERVTSAAELQESIAEALGQALASQDARFGWEESGDPRGGFRSVIQFRAGAELFDAFFNARVGYRAHFRVSRDCGLRYNRGI